jgi:DNA-binding CsgD family transcriptional regulator
VTAEAASATLLGARAIGLTWQDRPDGRSRFSFDLKSPPAFIQKCHDLADSSAPRRDGIVHERKFVGLGEISWLHRCAAAPGGALPLSVFALQHAQGDPDSLRYIATAARNAIAARVRMDAISATSLLKSSGFAQVPFGVAVVDNRLHIAESNDAFGAILARNDGLSALGGQLTCRDNREQAALSRMVATATLGQTAFDSTLRVSRGRRLPSYMVRLICSGGGAASALGLLLIVDPDAPPPVAIDLWRAVFELTDCELAIAEGLVQGLRVSDIAQRRGVSVETVRTQTKRLFERLGVSSQTEAALRLSRAAPFRQPTPAIPDTTTKRAARAPSADVARKRSNPISHHPLSLTQSTPTTDGRCEPPRSGPSSGGKVFSYLT